MGRVGWRLTPTRHRGKAASDLPTLLVKNTEVKMENANPDTGEIVDYQIDALQSRQIGKIAEALAKAQGALKPLKAGKTVTVKMKTGGQYNYKYADLADILQSAREALSKNGLAVAQTYEVGVPCVLNTTLMHTSGEWLKSSLPVNISQGMGPQDVGSLMTYFRRYALSALIGIAADEDDDGKGAQVAATKPPQKPAAAKPDAKLITEPQCQLLYACCQKQGVSSETAKAFLKEKYKVGAAKDIKKVDFDAILKWVKDQKPVEAPEPTGEADA